MLRFVKFFNNCATFVYNIFSKNNLIFLNNKILHVHVESKISIILLLYMHTTQHSTNTKIYNKENSELFE